MADELLSDIIHLENEIQQQQKAEQVRAHEWLERVRAEEEQRRSEVSRQQQEVHQEAITMAKRSAAAAAAAIEERAAEYCHQLEHFDESRLVGILERQLKKILPG